MVNDGELILVKYGDLWGTITEERGIDNSYFFLFFFHIQDFISVNNKNPEPF